MNCEHDECLGKAVYCIEWWGLNQYGKRPEMVDETYACENPRHIIKLSHHEDYGGYPDAIYNIETETYKYKRKLLSLVKQAIDGKLSRETIDNIVLIADPPKGQLNLFPKY